MTIGDFLDKYCSPYSPSIRAKMEKDLEEMLKAPCKECEGFHKWHECVSEAAKSYYLAKEVED